MLKMKESSKQFLEKNLPEALKCEKLNVRYDCFMT